MRSVVLTLLPLIVAVPVIVVTVVSHFHSSHNRLFSVGNQFAPRPGLVSNLKDDLRKGDFYFGSYQNLVGFVLYLNLGLGSDLG